MDNGFTKTPNEIFDLMAKVSPAEFKVIMVIVRQTYGYHKEHDAISLSQFSSMTGLSRQGVVNALALLEKQGIVTKMKIGNTFKYSVKIVNSVDQSTQLTSQLSLPEVVNSVDHLEPQIVNSVDTQKKYIKEINKDHATRADANAQPAKPPAKKDVQESAPNPTKAILDAYIEVRGNNGINYGKEGAAAKRIAKEGHTPEMIKGCYEWLKKDKFWEFKPVSLAVIFQNLPEYKTYLDRVGATASATRFVNGREQPPEGYRIVDVYGGAK